MTSTTKHPKIGERPLFQILLLGIGLAVVCMVFLFCFPDNGDVSNKERAALRKELRGTFGVVIPDDAVNVKCFKEHGIDYYWQVRFDVLKKDVAAVIEDMELMALPGAKISKKRCLKNSHDANPSQGWWKPDELREFMEVKIGPPSIYPAWVLAGQQGENTRVYLRCFTK